jgi:hypothetical protein
MSILKVLPITNRHAVPRKSCNTPSCSESPASFPS